MCKRASLRPGTILLWVGLTIAVGLTACSGANANTGGAVRSTDPATLAFAQVMTVVGTSESEIDAAALVVASCPTPPTQTRGTACSPARDSYAVAVASLAARLQAMTTPGRSAKFYVATGPIAVVIKQTGAAAEKIEQAQTEFVSACTTKPSVNCSVALDKWASAQRTVEAALAAWSPYVH